MSRQWDSLNVVSTGKTIYVRLDVEIQVQLPVEIPEDSIGEDGVLLNSKYREAAIEAACGWIHQSGEIDVSGTLGVPFHTRTRGPDHVCSLAKIFADVSDSDVTEVRIED